MYSSVCENEKTYCNEVPNSDVPRKLLGKLFIVIFERFAPGVHDFL